MSWEGVDPAGLSREHKAAAWRARVALVGVGRGPLAAASAGCERSHQV